MDRGHAFRMYPAKKPYLMGAMIGLIPMACMGLVVLYKLDATIFNIRTDTTFGEAIIEWIKPQLPLMGGALLVGLIGFIAGWLLLGNTFRVVMEWYYYDD